MPAPVAPRLLNRPHSVTADVEIPPGGAQGVLLCQGTNAGGWSLYVNHCHYAHNFVQRALHHVVSSETLPEGRHTLRFEFEPTGAPDITHGKGAPGRAQLYIDGRLVGQSDMPVTTPIAINPGGMGCGAHPGTGVGRPGALRSYRADAWRPADAPGVGPKYSSAPGDGRPARHRCCA
ncbi:hypothetical protein [Streptomyces sp. LN699]|uniref:hypothetical protein n=1 Tax=Streptomyces sp. LN699 TaxID=3112981 RepID=UPI003718515F